MSLHIKKIMEGMLILTILSSKINDKSVKYLSTEIRKLVRNGYLTILIDMTNVNTLESTTIEKLYEVNAFIEKLGGSLKFFGINESISKVLTQSESGKKLNLQTDELIETDMEDLLIYREVSLAS